MGGPSWKTILGNALFPRLVDIMLSRQAYSGQQIPEQTRNRPRNNLYRPPPGDYGTHGPFDSEARSHSLQVWGSTHRSGLTVLFGGGVLLAWWLWYRQRSGS